MAELTLLSSTPGGLTDAQLDRNMQNLNEDLGTKQPTHANLAALSGLVGAADKLPYFTGAGALSVTTLTAKARGLLASADEAAMRTTLGLGTAAVAAITTSPTDTTAGRVLKVGDFGLGAILVVADADSIPTGGSFCVLGSPFTNGPTASAYLLISDIDQGRINGTQFAVPWAGSAGTYRRIRSASAWGAWVETWTSSNLVKTTSATDTTAGSMLKVGDFGLGAVSSPPAPADLNTLLPSGLYRYNASTVNAPSAPAGLLLVQNWNSGLAAQTAFLADGTIQNRAYAGTTWLPWRYSWDSSATNAITSENGSFGYGAGSGATAVQPTSKSTGVPLNKPSGQITTASDAIAANSVVSFTLTNNKIGANDIPKVVIKSGATAGAYVVQVDAVAAGSCRISIRNMTGGSLSETLVLQFNIEKGAIA